ncbi:MAG: Nif11-like leader peptide family natural product precursor [Stigonema ocellatum SAG 48.90 = DSM 106950]|nr:Nif11-like leader peptide family natural product precursor [Stigonema ocellatum SAG 48.90 = DSM 106950]
MSTEAVNQFLQKVTEDPQLQEELAKALEADNDRQAATDWAAKQGYQFTPDELWGEIQNRQSEFQQRQDAGELNEEELEAVAGGATPAVVTAVTAVTSLIPKPKW